MRRDRFDDPAVLAYLAAFEAWLRSSDRDGFALELRAAAFEEMVNPASFLPQIPARDGESIRRDG